MSWQKEVILSLVCGWLGYQLQERQALTLCLTAKPLKRVGPDHQMLRTTKTFGLNTAIPQRYHSAKT
jgi:hypothetical protein